MPLGFALIDVFCIGLFLISIGVLATFLCPPMLMPTSAATKGRGVIHSIAHHRYPARRPELLYEIGLVLGLVVEVIRIRPDQLCHPFRLGFLIAGGACPKNLPWPCRQ